MTKNSDNLESCIEADIIQQLLENINPSNNVRVPAGDDCSAVVLSPDDTELLLTSDPVIEGVHFHRDTDADL